MKGTRRWPLTLLGVFTLALLSCQEPSPAGVDTGALPSRDDLAQTDHFSTGHLLGCNPLPADSASETIGPEGGTLQVGVHSLSVPPGALETPVTISAVAPTGPVNSVRFEPSGLTFSQPATLTMSYANCGLLWSFIPKRIAYTTDDLLQILSYLVSVDHWRSQRVTGQVDHFSTYAVAW